MELLPLIVLIMLALIGGAIGIAVALRGTGLAALGSAGTPQPEQGLLRVNAEVHTGWEQTLIGLIRELPLPRNADGAAYGQLYLESRTEHHMYVRTRSEIGRGFLGNIELIPRRGPTHLTYAILRLPGDDQLHERVLDFELQLIAAIRRIDSNANIHLAADALRNLDRPRPRSSSN